MSQTISDSIALKTTCLIFAEHEKLSIENSLLKGQIQSLEELNQLYVNIDSLQRQEIDLYKADVNSKNKQIKKLKSSHKFFYGGGILLFIIGLIL